MTVGGHFERVAAVYESLRTTDEAPVRAIGQLLPDRPVTGLDVGCGTGRYTRLLRALLPDGSRLAASDVSAAMLAQLTAGNHGHAGGVVPLLAAAEQLPLRTASLDVVTAFNCVHHFDLGRFLTAVARVLAPGGQLFIYTRTPQQNARTIWGRYFPGFTEHEQRLHSQAAIRDAVSGPAGSRWSQHRPSAIRARARPSGSRPRPRAATTRRSPSTPRRSCAPRSRPSWPACPAPRSAGWTSTCWSSSAPAAATRWSRTARAPGRTRRSRIRPSRSAPRAPARLPTDVLAAARRSPRYAPSRLLATTFGRAPRSARRAIIKGSPHGWRSRPRTNRQVAQAVCFSLSHKRRAFVGQARRLRSWFMPQNFLSPQRDQPLLLPVDMREWLPEDDLVFVVLDAVATLDLGEFRRRYRADGHGRAAFDPEMMVALLLYGYCQGERSSRVIEKRCVRDVGYRVIAGGLRPDHATIARFRARHEKALGGLFSQVLRLLAAEGMVSLGTAQPGRDQAGRQRRAEGEQDVAADREAAGRGGRGRRRRRRPGRRQRWTSRRRGRWPGGPNGGSGWPRARDRLAAEDKARRDAQRAKQEAWDAAAAAGKRRGRRPGR